MDALGLVEGHELGRGTARVELDLVDSWYDLIVKVSDISQPGVKWSYLEIRAGEELLKMLNAKVGNTNILHLTSSNQLLQLPPSITEIPILEMMRLIIRIRRARPMHQVQVNIVNPQIRQTVVNRLRNALVPWVIQLRCQPELVARYTGGFDAGANFLLVLVREGCVDVAVSGAEGVLDGFGDFVGLGLPCSETDGGDFVARVEGVGFAG